MEKSFRIIGVYIFYMLISFSAYTQIELYNNLKIKTISTKSSFPIDSLTIDPSSLFIAGLDTTCYHFSLQENKIFFNKKCILPDSVTIRYRHLPFNLSKKTRSEKYSFDSTFVFKIYDQDKQLWYQRTPLTYSGSYSRNMQVGNSQDMSMNSNFNLQVNGYLLDSIYIEGAITDNQLPFQPEGNTQQVQEFDRIYIILEKNKHKGTFGDFNLDKTDGHFLKFNKRGQGLFYQGMDKKWGNTLHNYGASVSVSKGQYARNQFEGIEGNQGPYKLYGNNGETFFIILAGTEKVFVDGKLMKRGEDKDYIINYNTSEIIFMPRCLITKDKRIQVEFEYQDRNYLNSLLYFYDNIKIGKKFQVNFSIYSNQDAKNQPYLQDFDDAQRNFLYGLGDSIHLAYYQNIKRDEFAPNKILYIQKDTTLTTTGETFFGIFEYSTDSTAILYSLSFSYVGENKGNYIISGENSNGRSYQWIAPLDGIPQGNYEPVSLLITPKMHQVFNLGFDYQIDSFKKLSVESSTSNYDPNLFSPIDNSSHLGFGVKVDYNEKRFFGKKDTLDQYRQHIENTVFYEYVQHNYKAISPFRTMEFARDWNILEGEQAVESHQHFGFIKTQYHLKDRGHALYQYSFFNQERFSLAHKNIAEIQYNPKNTLFRLYTDILNSKSENYQSFYFRPHAVLERKFEKLANTQIGTRWELEHNDIRNALNDTLSPLAFSFSTWTTFIRNEGIKGMVWDVKYIQRKENLVDSGSFELNNIGHTIETSFQLTNIENHQLDVSLGYRYLELFDTNKISASNAGGRILGRINYSGIIGNGFLVPTIQYEFGNGQEQKREFTYVEVPAGQGMYYWVDYNEDGVQQANEFEIGIYPDQKRFIRVFTPTNEYIGMSYYTLQSSINLNFSKLFDKNSKGLKGFVTKFQNQFSIQSNNKTIHQDNTGKISTYLPFTSSVDSLIIGKSTSLMNTLFFNRSNSLWGADYSIFYTENKTLLTYGLESQQWLRQIITGRWSISKAFTTQVRYNWAERNYYSGINDGRTYDFTQRVYSGSLSYIYAQTWRITGTYLRDMKKNAEQFGGENALIQNMSLDVRMSYKKLGSIQSSFTYSLIKFNGNENTAVGLIMLDALKNGNNLLWNLQWNTMLTKGIEMSLNYEGRKPAGQQLIHTGNMTIRAML